MARPGMSRGDRPPGPGFPAGLWGPGNRPRIITPRRIVTGAVVGLFSEAPAVVKVRTGAGETLCIRVTGR